MCEVDPNEYREKFGPSLVTISQMPKFLQDIKPPPSSSQTTTQLDPGKQQHQQQQQPQPLSSNLSNESFHLEGDLEALKLIDLDEYGLSQYKRELERRGILKNNAS